MLMEQSDDNVIPFVEDIKLQIVIYFTQNEVNIQKSYSDFEQNETNYELWVQEELENALTTFRKHNIFAKNQNICYALKLIHLKVLIFRLEYLKDIKEDAIKVAKIRWTKSLREVNEREPFRFHKFHKSLSLVHAYIAIIMEVRVN